MMTGLEVAPVGLYPTELGTSMESAHRSEYLRMDVSLSVMVELKERTQQRRGDNPCARAQWTPDQER